MSQVYTEMIAVDGALPGFTHLVTAKDVVSGAAASRDWQPLHHDYRHAAERAGTGNIIMNTSTQQGWISRYVTDWAGPEARLFAISIRMRSSLCPGDQVLFTGKIMEMNFLPDGLSMVKLEVSLGVGDRLATIAVVSLVLPGEGSNVTPWDCDGEALKEFAI